MKNGALLEVRDLSLAYGDVQVLFGVSLRVDEGEIVTLLGSNGAGKTTTLRAISGLRPPRGGDITFRGESLLKVPASRRAELGIALVPEGRELWPQLTVRENLELGSYTKSARGRMKQNRFATLYRVGAMREIVGRHSLKHGSRSLIKIELVGNLNEPIGRYRGIFSITPKHTGVGHAVSWSHSCYLRTYRDQ